LRGPGQLAIRENRQTAESGFARRDFAGERSYCQ
jgi:hypothetical protein